MTPITRHNRKILSGEQAYWDAIDRGDNIAPPIPCRDCGLVWVHDPRCICEGGRVSYELSNAPSLHLRVSTETTLAAAAERARNKAAAFFGTEPQDINLHLKYAERDVNLETTSAFSEPGRYVETAESYHCSFKATVRA